MVTEFLHFYVVQSFSSFDFSLFVFRRSFPFLRCDKYSFFFLVLLKMVLFTLNCLIRLEFIQITAFFLTHLCVFKEIHVCCRKFGKQNLQWRKLLLLTVLQPRELLWILWRKPFNVVWVHMWTHNQINNGMEPYCTHCRFVFAPIII